MTSSPCGALTGTLTPPGDKSISHRSIMLGGIAEGTTTIRGLLEGEDVLRTMAALTHLGAKAHHDSDGTWHITGVGLKGLRAPTEPLDMGNSGTAARLLMGLLAGRPFNSTFVGDASLQKRPMRRVMTPLAEMGIECESTDGRMPLTVKGTENIRSITYTLPMASAQVKSAVLLAGLSIHGTTTVIETTPTRDHSENMLRAFGADIRITPHAGGGEEISITGPATLRAQNITVPADISSAAFPMVAAILRPHSHLTLRHVGINPRRAGLIENLQDMGARLTLTNQRIEGGEPIADIIVESSPLHGATIPAHRAPSMIDEYPILAAAAACATGTTRLLGLHELRVKESDRLAQMAKGLAQCGVNVVVDGDDLIIHGTGTPPMGGGNDPTNIIETAMDHRIAMSFLILGGAAQTPIRIDDGGFIVTSFPRFTELMNSLGMDIRPCP